MAKLEYLLTDKEKIHDPRTLSRFEGRLSLSSHSKETLKGTTSCTQGRQTVTEGSCKETHKDSTREWAGVVGQGSSNEWLTISALRRAVIFHPLQVSDQPQVRRAETQKESSPLSTLHTHQNRGGKRVREKEKENPLGEADPWHKHSALNLPSSFYLLFFTCFRIDGWTLSFRIFW